MSAERIDPFVIYTPFFLRCYICFIKGKGKEQAVQQCREGENAETDVNCVGDPTESSQAQGIQKRENGGDTDQHQPCKKEFIQPSVLYGNAVDIVQEKQDKPCTSEQ